jgi:hypothetical protein
MSADDTREELFVALRVLSKITPNDRIETNGSTISLDTASWRGIQWFHRWWRQEDRIINIQRTRRIFSAMRLQVTNAADLYEAWSLVASNSSGAGGRNNTGGSGGGGSTQDLRSRMEDTKTFIARALDALESASNGVHNLCTTYKSNDNITAQIEELIETVRTFIETTRRRVGLGQSQSHPPHPPQPPPQQHSAPRGGHPIFSRSDDEDS